MNWGMDLNPNGRRSFLRKCTALCLLTGSSGLPFTLKETSHQPHRIRVLDRERVFVSGHTGAIRPIPDRFVHRLFPKLPEVPDTLEVNYPWKKENCAHFKERALDGLGAINDGILADGQNILQIIPTTPTTPDTQSGSPLYKCWYRLSTDGGKNFTDFKLIVQDGNAPDYPVKGVKIGRNGYTIPLTSPFVKGSNGEILIPVHLHPWDEERQMIYNPADAYLFGDSGVLIGEWTADRSDLRWKFGEWLRIDHRLSTRGLFEPSIVELSPGHFAMVMRGSNLKKPDLPSYAWLSFSSDYCRTWTTPKPFSYSDGQPFFVPAACSTLFRSVFNQKLYWIGNICDQNPSGNHPRYPLVMGRVDEKKFGLIRESVVVIDHRVANREDLSVELSNYKILECPDTPEIVVAVTRREKGTWAKAPSWFQILLD